MLLPPLPLHELASAPPPARGHPTFAPPQDPQPLTVSTRRSSHVPPQGRIPWRGPRPSSIHGLLRSTWG
jgi:hypothetical protein